MPKKKNAEDLLGRLHAELRKIGGFLRPSQRPQVEEITNEILRIGGELHALTPPNARTTTKGDED